MFSKWFQNTNIKDAEIQSYDDRMLIVRLGRIFHWLLVSTLVIPLLTLVIQFIFTWDQLHYDPTKLENWTGVHETFSLPIGVFTLFIALTSLVGLYWRGLKMQAQLEVSHKQYNLAQKKETLAFYIGHKNLFGDHVDHLLMQYASYSKEFAAKVTINQGKMYERTFPNNSHEKVENFSMSASAPVLNHSRVQSDIKISQLNDFGKATSHFGEIMVVISTFISPTGLIVNSELGQGFDKEGEDGKNTVILARKKAFLKELTLAMSILREVNLIDEKAYQFFTDSIQNAHQDCLVQEASDAKSKIESTPHGTCSV
ncbi:hypothetical protein [Pseudoalteromonas obscura]|uniref:Uncharacterized protein n=1 Tax=Pseudoalteromonas obscura TaxID=3048491 RepID=A0ABT7ENJ6_9GAMM|nr:hypothetical protein [Pseudoalteromonas sp. P94(2023)]MDK2596570.1 hypothetical protein [Pseudoalteromonas sp. P94(2023)]